MANQFSHDQVFTAGMSVHEDFQLNVQEPGSVREVLDRVRPRDIVVTAGINIGEPIGSDSYSAASIRSIGVNFVGVMEVLNQWMKLGPDQDGAFVAISSNSSHIARRGSTAYCASKAALSMAIRCAAREIGGRPLVYAYEFGLLMGTPMTQGTEARFGPSQTRMVGAEKGLDVLAAAKAISNNLVAPWHGLNGALIRLDAGEQ